MDVIDLIGRILFASVFLINGWNHLANREPMTGYAKAMGTPAAEIAVPATGIAMLFSGLTIALGVWADLGALLMVVFLPVAAVIFHAYWKESDPQAQAAQQAQFWKNIALTGAALIVLATFSDPAAAYDLAVGSPLF